MFKNIEWLFFDIGSTLVDEQIAYEHRFQEIAEAANKPYEDVYSMAVEMYKENRKGDKEVAKALGVELPKWHGEDERLYKDTPACLEALHSKYKIGIIANQELGTEERLKRWGILKYIDLVVASAEEGVAKPDRKIFEIALERGHCKSENAVMIGDRIDNDIVPAKAMGMHTIWVKQGFGRHWKVKDESEKADVEVEGIREIGRHL